MVRLHHIPLLNPTPPANCLPVCYRLLAGDSFWNSCNWPGNGWVGFKQDSNGASVCYQYQPPVTTEEPEITDQMIADEFYEVEEEQPDVCPSGCQGGCYNCR